MIRPTRRGALIFGSCVPLALLLISAAPWAWVFAVNYAALAALAIGADALLACRGRQLIVRIDTPARLFIGQAGAVTVTIQARGHPRTVRIDLLADQQGELDPPAIVTLPIGPGETAIGKLPMQPRRRGRISVDRVWLRWRGPLALIQYVRVVPVDRTIDVLPSVHGMGNTAFQFFAREALFGIRAQRERGEGTEFDALRDYVPGLDTRFIDWKHSARHHELVCKEFRVERNHPIILAFDTGHLMLEPIDGIPRLDHAIAAGLQLAWTALRGGDLAGLYAFDAQVRQFVAPMRGMNALSHLQRAAAGLNYHHEETNFTLGLAELSARSRRRGLVVLFTDFVDTVTAELMVESIRLVARRHQVIFACLSDPFLTEALNRRPDRFEDAGEAVIAADFLRERRTVFERLDRLGVHCLDVSKEAFSVALINRYLAIKQRGLL